MKRLFLISIMLLLLGAVYADGPRYRFKSRRALQTLWRNQMKENPNANGYGYRRMTARELQGENADEMQKGERVYGVAVANPFDDNITGSGQSDSGSSPFGNTMPSLTTTTPGSSSILDPSKTDNGEHGGLVSQPGSGTAAVGGSTSSKSGQGGEAPPYPPVGDGVHILLIFTAAFIAIKKRLSD